jgi:O-antigen/teichoic acid export membrane protein
MAVSGFLASLIQTLLFIKPEWRINQPQDEIMGKKILLDHWSYGRWSVLSRTMVWAQININYIVLPLIMSVAMSAALRATLNLVMPVFMAISSTMTIILPYFVRSYTERGRSQLNRLVILVLTGYLTVAFLLGVLVIFFGQWAINYLYNGKFDEFVTFKYVFAIAILPALAAASTTMNAALLAVGGVKRSFFAKIIPLILSLTLGIYLLWQFGLIGAPIGAIIVQLVTIGLVCYEYQNFNEEKAII